ncbi:MAG: phosphomannomutase/phosphoglucomutase [Alphaproteobacteria bacterium]|nr:phosphomannomutase/phosphoglucomutase [Alphaproteobacteria bacterium]
MAVRGHGFHPTALRQYDIRGVVGDTLTTTDALALGRTLGSIAVTSGGRVAVVGYDGRHSSPLLEEELSRGLASCGLFVLRIGLCPTPMVYFASRILKAAVGVMVTGSHNPPEYNGFKMVLGNKPFYGENIQRLGDHAARGAWIKGQGGVVGVSAADAYVARLLKDYQPRAGLRVAWDPGNGAAGEVLVRLLHRLPGEHVLINERIDGSFPSHHPDPTVEANLEQLKDLVLKEKCDIGIAFDGDGDRIGVVDSKARPIWGDQLLAILAREVLQQRPGATVIADVKASQSLFDEIRRLGGAPEMCATGHSIIKTRMAETDAPLAGEMSGHIFMADRYYGYDDALYVAVRLLNYIVRSGRSAADLRDELPETVNTPEIRVEVDDSEKFAIIARVTEAVSALNLDVNSMDGVRVNEAGGWWLIRASNTQNCLVVRCEAPDMATLGQLKDRVRAVLSDAGVPDALI